MKASECLLEFKKIDTTCKLHGLWFTLSVACGVTYIYILYISMRDVAKCSDDF